MAANKLGLNKSKTEYVIIGSHQIKKRCNSDCLIKIGNMPIKRVSASKSLRVMIDENLTWHSQVDLITKKVNQEFLCSETTTRVCRTEDSCCCI